MKKLMLAALALGIALGSVSFAAQDAQTTDKATTAKKKKAKKAKKTSDTSAATTNKM